jgi:hypothetical protein
MNWMEWNPAVVVCVFNAFPITIPTGHGNVHNGLQLLKQSSFINSLSCIVYEKGISQKRQHYCQAN